jgi:nuclear pore complex protein Nup210
LIKIQPLYEGDGDCARSVLITAISREKTKKTAILLAESRETGEVLRCDVILDLIHKFGVHTTTRELYLEEAAETFELMAQDSQGNDFTTLEGIEFNWKIGVQNRASKETDKDSKSRYQVLRFLTFSESKYHQVPKEVEKFEMTGLKGHMVLLEGINSGSAKVIVKLPYPEYQNVAEVEVDITVLANLLISPVDVHILVGDSIDFKVLQLKQGKLHEITLGAQYYLQIENQNTAKISGGRATGISLGTTSVILMDKNVIENTFKTPMPKARLTVSDADKITLNLLPYYNWITVADEKHEIAIDLYTKDDQKITLGNRYRLKSSFDDLLFRELKRNSNGSRIYGETISPGTNPVSGSFEHVS